MYDSYIQEMGEKLTSFGQVLYIKIRRYDDKPMSWSEVFKTYAESYPSKWAIQFFPPVSECVDDANIYHLYILDEPPTGFSIKWQ